MTHHFFPSPEVLERLYVGPLSDHIDRFARLLLDQGYATKTAQEKIRIVADLSRWLERKQLKVNDLDEQRINEYLKFRATHHAPVMYNQPFELCSGNCVTMVLFAFLRRLSTIARLIVSRTALGDTLLRSVASHK